MNKFNKDECKHKDWKNKKEILAKDIAYCIYTHGLPFKNVPDERKRLVQKEIDKLRSKLTKQKDDENNRKSIELVLSIHESDAAIHEFLINGTQMGKLKPDSPDTVIGYIFDPDLFANVKSADDAITITKNLESSLTRAIMQNGVRFKDKYPKDIQSAQNATKKLLETYEKIGIPKSVTIKALQSIDWVPKGTLKQELDSWRESLTDYFLSLGNTKTNSASIAKAITSHCEKIY